MTKNQPEEVEYTSFIDCCRSYRGNSILKNIFFDTEFSKILPLVKELKDVCDVIQRRIDKRELAEVAPSKYAFINLVDNENRNPELCYTFRFRDDIVRIIRVHRIFHIACSFAPKNIRSYRLIPDIYGEFGNLDDAKKAYLDVCSEILTRNGFSYELF